MSFKRQEIHNFLNLQYIFGATYKLKFSHLQFLGIGIPVAIYIDTYNMNEKMLADNIKHLLRLNTKIFLFWRGTNLHIEEIYKAGSRIEQRKLAWWSKREGLKFGNGSAVYLPRVWMRRSNLTGMHLRAASVSNPPLQIIKRRFSNGQIELDGVIFEIFLTLQELMNFR